MIPEIMSVVRNTEFDSSVKSGDIVYSIDTSKIDAKVVVAI